MNDPKKKRYLYLMLAGFGSISLSILTFFALYRLRGIGELFQNVASILAPFIYGGVVAYLLRPLCNRIESFLIHHLPGGLKKIAPITAVIGSLLALFLILYALGAMIFPQVYDSVVALGKTIPGRLESFISWAETTFGENEYMDEVFDVFNTSYEKLYMGMKSWIQNLIPQINTLVSSVGSSVFSALSSLYNLVIGMIVTVYVLFSRKRFARQGTLIVRSALNEKWANIVLDEVALVDRMFGGFIDAKILDSLIIGVLCYLGCRILVIPNTLLISVFVGVTNIIPFFGPLIGAVPATLLILIESPIKAVWFVVFVVILQQLDGNVIGPRIMGNKIGISGFWVMLGMVIGVPLFAVIYDVVRKLVKLGLRKKGKLELWEQYTADYPNEDMPTKASPESQRIDWSREAVLKRLSQLRDRGKAFCTESAVWLKKVWEKLKTWALAVWNFLQVCAAWCRSQLQRLTEKFNKK